MQFDDVRPVPDARHPWHGITGKHQVMGFRIKLRQGLLDICKRMNDVPNAAKNHFVINRVARLSSTREWPLCAQKAGMPNMSGSPSSFFLCLRPCVLEYSSNAIQLLTFHNTVILYAHVAKSSIHNWDIYCHRRDMEE